MITQFKNLEDILNNNPGLRDLVIQEFQGKKEHLSDFNDLISFFTPTHRDELIVKIKKTNTLNLFQSLIAELYCAKIFAQKGCDFELLPDDYFSGASPDLLCKYHDLSFYVEVTSLSNSDPTVKIIDELRELVRDKPFVVNVNFNHNVSQPCFSGKEHEEQETLLNKSLEQFKTEFVQLTPDSSVKRIETDSITFIISPILEKPGLIGGLSSGYRFPTGIFEKFGTRLLLKKGGKREKFVELAKNFPYILTFVSGNVAVDDIDFKHLLYGRAPTILIDIFDDPEENRLASIQRDKEWEEILQNQSQYIPKWQEIDTAAKSGWNSFLTEIDYIPHDYTYLAKEGLFLSEPLMKNVSGILLLRKSIEPHFYPNPFCDHEISLVNHQEFFNSF
ncbi:MAG: hypothetical protein WC626_09545 [Methanoregula sp.]